MCPDMFINAICVVERVQWWHLSHRSFVSFGKARQQKKVRTITGVVYQPTKHGLATQFWVAPSGYELLVIHHDTHNQRFVK